MTLYKNISIALPCLPPPLKILDYPLKIMAFIKIFSPDSNTRIFLVDKNGPN